MYCVHRCHVITNVYKPANVSHSCKFVHSQVPGNLYWFAKQVCVLGKVSKDVHKYLLTQEKMNQKC